MLQLVGETTIPEKDVVIRNLQEAYRANGDFRVQYQGPNGTKTEWLFYSDWCKKYEKGEIGWIPTDRTVLPQEFVLEFDPCENETQGQLESRSILAENICIEKGINYQKFHSGNKSWHFHVALPGLGKLDSVEKRNRVRRFFAEHFFSAVKPYDENLFNESHMIRLPGAVNPKSGKVKCFVSGKITEMQLEIPGEVIAKANREEKRIESVIVNPTAEKTPFVEECNCLAYACGNKLPVGNRQQVYAKNFVATVNWAEKKHLFIAAQNDTNFTENNLQDWMKYSVTMGKQLEFNCLELKKTLAEDGLRILCNECPYYNKHFLDAKELPQETKYGQFRIRCEVRPMGIKRFFTYQNLTFGNDSVITDEIYSVFSFKFGHGNPESYIIETPDSKMSGDNRLYLKPITKQKLELFVKNPPTLDKLLKMISISKIGKDETISDLLDIMVRRQTGTKLFLFEAVPGIPSEELGKLSNEECRQIVEDFITMGCEIDELMILEFLSDILVPNPALIAPDRYMKYNPHSICYTFTTKVGKTSIAERTSMRMDKVTTFALFGGGTSDRERAGDLEGTVLPLRVDELQEDNEMNKKNVLSYMETGIWSIASGMHSGKDKKSSYSSLHFMGNPINNQEEQTEKLEEWKVGEGTIKDYVAMDASLDLLNRFVNTLGRISDNYGALGSRLGFVIFLDNIQPVNPETMFDEKTEKILFALVDGLRRATSDSYTRLFSKPIVISWLNKKYDGAYLAKIDEAKKIANLLPVKDFMSQYPESYRHLRGKALKIACTEYMADLAHDAVEIDKLLQRAENIFTQLQTITTESIFKIANISSGDNSKAVMRLKFDNYPLHVKAVILACLLFGVENGERKRFSSLVLRDSLNRIAKSMNYTQWAPEIVSRVANKSSIYSEKLKIFGISLLKTEDDLVIFVSNFDLLLELFSNKSKEITDAQLAQMQVGGESDD